MRARQTHSIGRRVSGGVRYVITGCLLFLVAAACYAGTANEERLYDIDIPALDAAEALNRLAEQTDSIMLFPYDLAAARQANAVAGRYTLIEALSLLLKGSGLSGGLSDKRVIQISLDASEERREREAQMTNKNETRKKAGLGAMIATLLSVAATADESSDTRSRDVGEREDADALEEIVVTGTNIRGIANDTVPVISVDRKEIELAGVQSFEDIGRLIPQNFAGQVTPLNLGGTTTNPFDSSDVSGASAFDLRGLGTDATLTLFNGRRLAPSSNGAFVDVGRLPIGVVQRVDVLLDGATSAYGSDAVAGVVNIITARDFEGVEASAHGGSVTEGDKFDYGAGLLAGARWDSGGMWASVDYFENDPLSAEDRAYTSFANPGAQLMVGSDGISVFASFDQELAARVKLTLDAIYNQRDAVYRFRPDRNDFDIYSDRSDLSAFTAIEFGINENWSSKLFLDYSESKNSAVGILPDGTFLLSYGSRTNELLIAEANLSGALFTTRAGALTAVFGIQRREEDYTPVPVGFLSATNRDISAVYAETLIPIFGGQKQLPLIKRLDLNLSARYEDYSDFGSTTNPRAGLYWQLTEGLAVRSSISTSFRAPSQFEQTVSRSIAVSERVDPNLDPADQDSRLSPGNAYVAAVRGGNPELTEQTSDNWSVGFVFSPPSISGLKVEASFFDVDFSDRIGNVPFNALLFPEYAALVVRNPSPEFLQEQFDEIIASNGPDAIFNFLPVDEITGEQIEVDLADVQVWVFGGSRNIGRVEVRGLDGLIEYGWSSGNSEFVSQIKASYLTDYDQQITAIAEPVQQVDRVYRPVGLAGRAALYWTLGGITASGALNYTDDYIDNINGPEPVKISSWATLDTSLSVDFSDLIGSGADISATLAVQNLLDRDPPFINSLDGFGYDSTNASPLGRYVSLRLVGRW